MSVWKPTKSQIEQTNIARSMRILGLQDYQRFWEWSINNRSDFWEHVIEMLNIPFDKKPSEILDVSRGVTHAHWFIDAQLNIVNACFNHPQNKTALHYRGEDGKDRFLSYKDLNFLINRIANGLKNHGLNKGDIIAIDMPMTVEAVAIYLAGIKAGMAVATVADSFTAHEIQVRFDITNPKLVFTQDVLLRAGKSLPLYEKLININAPKTVVIPSANVTPDLREKDVHWDDFLSDDNQLKAIACTPDDTTTILFSSGTTSTPKAIPWSHITPIKSAMDGYFHQDIHPEDVVAWPTNLGWMMGPWLVFASLINGATMALYGGAPMGEEFGQFVQDAKISVLGLVPSMVKHWKATKSMEAFDWSAIKCFSSTGEASNPNDYTYLMQLGGNKPIIEYCGGTEIGGGYVTGTLVQDNIPATFSTKALGSDFVLLDENFEAQDKGEVFLLPPTLGLSNKLLNKDHYKVYYKDLPIYKGQVLRRHGDEMIRLNNGYYKAQGRADDAMNLGGIKVSSVQIEEVVNTLDFIKESAAISVPPKDGGPEVLVIFYVPTKKIESELAFVQIKNIVKNEINPLFKVNDVVKTDTLPRTASGKVKRRDLRQKYQH